MFNSSNRGGDSRSPVGRHLVATTIATSIASWSPLGRHFDRQYDRHYDRRDDRLVYSLHSLIAARNQLWVVEPSMLTDLRQQPMRQQQQSPESRTMWLIYVVRGLPAGRFQPWCGGVVCLLTWYSRRASESYVRSGRRRM